MPTFKVSPSISPVSTTVVADASNSFDIEASQPLLDPQDNLDQDDHDDEEFSDHFWQTLLAGFCGWNVGLVAQLVAVRANARQVVEWNNVAPTANEDLEGFVRFYLYTALCHADVIVCVILWLYFMLCRTHTGVTQFQSGMYLLLGVLCGSSAAWMGLDYILGFPVSLSVMLFTLAANLAVCFAALKYHAPGQENNDDNDNTEK